MLMHTLISTGKWTYNRPSPISPIHAERLAELELINSVLQIPLKKYPSTKHSCIEQDLSTPHIGKKMFNDHKMDIKLSLSPNNLCENQRIYGKCDGSISLPKEDDPKFETCSIGLSKFLDRPKPKDEGRSRLNLDGNHILKRFPGFEHKTYTGKDAMSGEPLTHSISEKSLENVPQIDKDNKDAQLGTATSKTNMQARTGTFYPNSSLPLDYDCKIDTYEESDSGGLSPKCQFCDNDVKRSTTRVADVTLDHLRTRTSSPCKSQGNGLSDASSSSPNCETQLCACGHNSNSKKRRWPNNGTMDIMDLHIKQPTERLLKRENMHSRTNSRSSLPRSEITNGNFGDSENCHRPCPLKSCQDQQVKMLRNTGSQTPSSASCSPSGRTLINGIPMNESIRSTSPPRCPFEDYFDYQRKSYQRNKNMRDYLNNRKEHKNSSSPSRSFEEQFMQQKKDRRRPTKDNDEIKLQQKLSPPQRTTRPINKKRNLLSTQRMKSVTRTTPSPCARMWGGSMMNAKPSSPCGSRKNCSNLVGNGHNGIGDTDLTQKPHVNLSSQSKGDFKSNTGPLTRCNLNANIASDPHRFFGSGLNRLKLTNYKNHKSTTVSSNGPSKDQGNIQIITPSSSEVFADLDHIISTTNSDPATRSTSPRGHPGDVDRNFVKAKISSARRAHEGLNLRWTNTCQYGDNSTFPSGRIGDIDHENPSPLRTPSPCGSCRIRMHFDPTSAKTLSANCPYDDYVKTTERWRDHVSKRRSMMCTQTVDRVQGNTKTSQKLPTFPCRITARIRQSPVQHIKHKKFKNEIKEPFRGEDKSLRRSSPSLREQCPCRHNVENLKYSQDIMKGENSSNKQIPIVSPLSPGLSTYYNSTRLKAAHIAILKKILWKTESAENDLNCMKAAILMHNNFYPRLVSEYIKHRKVRRMFNMIE